MEAMSTVAAESPTACGGIVVPKELDLRTPIGLKREIKYVSAIVVIIVEDPTPLLG